MLLVRERLRGPRALVTRKDSTHVMKSSCAIARRMLRGSRILRGDTTLMERRVRVPRVLVIRDDSIANPQREDAILSMSTIIMDTVAMAMTRGIVTLSGTLNQSAGSTDIHLVQMTVRPATRLGQGHHQLIPPLADLGREKGGIPGHIDMFQIGSIDSRRGIGHTSTSRRILLRQRQNMTDCLPCVLGINMVTLTSYQKV